MPPPVIGADRVQHTHLEHVPSLNPEAQSMSDFICVGYLGLSHFFSVINVYEKGKVDKKPLFSANFRSFYIKKKESYGAVINEIIKFGKSSEYIEKLL